MITRRSGWPFLAVGVIAAALSVAPAALALHTQSPPITQVTHQTSGTVGQSAVWGDSVWYFQDSGDPIGTGNTTPEMFQYHHDLRILGQQLGLTQVTCGGFNPANPSISAPSFGDYLAFDADGTLCRDPRHNCMAPFDASSTHRQVYMYIPASGQIRQLTDCAGDCTNPSLSESGTFITFQSQDDILGKNGGSAYGRPNIYFAGLNALGPNCPMLPCGPGRANRGVKNLSPYGGRNSWINFSGKYVTYESDGDPLNNGANPGIPHIYVVNVKKNITDQVPPGSMLPARNPTLDQGGRRVAYEIDVPRSSGPPITEIWVSKFRHDRAPITMSITPGATANSFRPFFGPNGRRVSFVSQADPLMSGTQPVNQLFTYTLIGTKYSTKRLLQTTGGPVGADLPTQSSFLFAGFSSADDFLGNGNTTSQFFVADLYKRAPGVPPPNLPGTPTPHPTNTPRPTATPVIGIPASIALGLVSDHAVNNGDNTLTMVIAATVSDYFGNPVPDGTLVQFSVAAPNNGIVVGNGATNTDPDCDVTTFEQKTGVQVQNRPGVAHVCVTYPGALSRTDHVIFAEAGPTLCVGGPKPATPCVDNGDCDPGTCEHTGIGQGTLPLPVPVNECTANGQACSDGNPCTLNDVCGGGTNTCVGGLNPGAPCTSDAQCASDSGGYCQVPTCQPGTVKTCADDGNLCTSDECNIFTGQCYTPVTCLDDGNPCTDDVCDPATGLCGIPNNAPCNDHDPCTVGDQCSSGSCIPGPEMTCPDDGNNCTLDVCNPLTGTCGIRFDPCACSAP